MTIKNAKITRTILGAKNHGISTFMITLDYGGSSQGFGNFALDQPRKEDGEFIGRFGTAEGMQIILDIIACLELDCWEDLTGTLIRVDANMDGIRKIGHFMKPNWFSLP